MKRQAAYKRIFMSIYWMTVLEQPNLMETGCVVLKCET